MFFELVDRREDWLTGCTVDPKRDVIYLLWPSCDFYRLSSRRTFLPSFCSHYSNISGIFQKVAF